MNKIKSTLIIIFLSLLIFIAVSLTIRFLFTSNEKNIFIILSIIFYFINTICSIYIINNYNPQGSIAWLVLIIALPIFGTITYFIFCTKQKEKKRQLFKTNINYTDNTMKIIYSLTGLPPLPIQKCKYFPRGEEAIKAIKEELLKAKKYIYIEFYIIEKGKVWDELFKVIKEKIKQGIEVYIIYDDYGCFNKKKFYQIKELSKMGIKITRFNKITPLITNHVNYRNHRKLIIIDQNTIFVGGINIADEYANIKEVYGYWRDTMIMVKGDFINSITTKINSLQNKTIEEEENIPKDKEEGEVQLFLEQPFTKFRIMKSAFLSLINDSKKYIYITTPYFICDYEIKNALIIASLRGVDVRIVVPSVADKKIIYMMSEANFFDLKDSFVKIYQYLPGFLHAKMILVDGKKVLVGSANFDYRSLYLNYEVAGILYDAKEITKIYDDFLSIIKESKIIDYPKINQNIFKKIIIAFLKCFETLL